MKTIISSVLCFLMVVNLTACGTILYPERKGQTKGQLDSGVVILNAVGLLFFLVPGVIAFAVDFSNGTIYLPDGRQSQLSDEELESISLNNEVNVRALEVLVGDKMAKDVSITGLSLQVKKVASQRELAMMFLAHNKKQYAGL